MWQQYYNRWKEFDELDNELRQQLQQIENDEKLLEDSFYKYMEFGTGGMRGEIGPGTNRMNIYTIRKTAEGLARYIEMHGEEAKMRGVVIAYDPRHKSAEFAMETVKVLGVHGIKTYLFESLRATPQLSFTVRYLQAFSGVIITASHNPKEYNGFKVYGPDGAQLSSEDADKITAKVNEVENELTVIVVDKEYLINQGLLEIIGEKVDEAYLHQINNLTLNRDVIKEIADDFCIVYTPLHGAGNIPVRKGLEAIGFKHIEVVKEQELPDPEFSTVKYPNPEEHSAFEIAIQYGEKHNADILLATDPDADRVGVAVRNKEGKYQVLTGNQIGALLLDYLIRENKKQGTLKDDATVVKTIVTSEIGRDIAERHELKTIDTLTGFKYISEQIQLFEETGEHSFLFGYEESYGYLIGDFVRDKDAIQACLLISEVAAYYKSNGKTLYEGLIELYETYGYYKEDLISVTLKGKDGVQQMLAILENFRNDPPKEFNGRKVLVIEDYQNRLRNYTESKVSEKITLPQSNVLKYKLENDAWVCIRPSGTEPKIKFYFGVKENTYNKSLNTLEYLKTAVMDKVDKIINIHQKV